MVTLLSSLVSGFGLGTLEREFIYRPDEISSIEYNIVRDSEDVGTLFSFTIEYDGELEQFHDLNIPSFWYSTKGDKLNNWVERKFDLTGVTSATLTFYTQYWIEYSYDFGYIEVSADNGTSWTQLPTAHTTTYVAPDLLSWSNRPDWYAYNQPAFSGVQATWIQETADLTPFVGNDILLRFRYVSDNFGVSRRGWYIDDIEIPELGFFDDMESGKNGWEPKGFALGEIRDLNSTIVNFSIDFVVPDDFVYNGTKEKVIVTKLIASDYGWNPAYAATKQISSLMPPITKYLAPPTPPSGGGGGGGGGGPTTYFTYVGDSATYYISFLPPGVVEHIRPGKLLESPIIKVLLTVTKGVRNVKISIVPLPNKPSNIIWEPPNVYKYFNIEAPNIGDSFGSMGIKFFVVKSWLEEKGSDVGDVVLVHWVNGKMIELPTKFIGWEGANAVFEATTGSLSTFAIVLKGTEPEPPLAEPISEIDPLNMSEMVIVINNVSDLEEIKSLFEAKAGEEVDVWEAMIIDKSKLQTVDEKIKEKVEEKSQAGKDEEKSEVADAVETKILELLGLEKSPIKQMPAPSLAKSIVSVLFVIVGIIVAIMAIALLVIFIVIERRKR
ncbi:PGF-pre-PGF domain-containing protein [Nanoarchaeota archaeon]